MSRQQKRIWNPVLVVFKPSHLSWLSWIVLLPFMYNDIDSGEPSFLLGLAVGLSFLQVGYAWGKYHDHWWRFFIENRSSIFNSSADNHPTKKKALLYVVATFAKRAYTPIAILSAIAIFYANDRYIGIEINFIFELLAVCFLGALSSYFMTKQIERWGEETTKRLTDFSYVFDSEPENVVKS
jgi:hypothetical protein